MTPIHYPNGRVYLAGPIAGLTYDGCTEWRDAAGTALAAHGIAAFSPMRNKEFLKDKGVLYGTYTESPMSGQKAIFERDHFDCVRADVLLVNLLGAERVSIGTMFELAWASENRIPVVLIMEEAGNIHDHAFVREAASFRVTSVEQATEVVKSILLPGVAAFVGSRELDLRP